MSTTQSGSISYHGTSDSYPPLVGHRHRLRPGTGHVDTDWPRSDELFPGGGFELLLHEVFRHDHKPDHQVVQADHAIIPGTTTGATVRRMVLLHDPILLDAVAFRLFSHGHAVIPS